MKIWFVEIGEPLPVEPGARLMRYGTFTEWLAARGHDVTWFTCTFSHMPKAHVMAPGTQVLDNGVRLVALPGPGYQKYISYARFHHLAVFAKNLRPVLEEKLAAQGRPDIIINPIPTCETVKAVRDFAVRHGIPYIVDVRDNWPQDFVNRMPLPVKPLAYLGLAKMFWQAKAGCRDAAGLCGTTQHRVNYACHLAGRKQDARDRVFYIGYTRPVLREDDLAQAGLWWREQGLRDDAKIFCYLGTISASSDMTAIVQAAAALKKRGDIQVVIAGDGDRRRKWMDLAATHGLDRHDILFPGWVNQVQITYLLNRATAAFEPYVPGAGIAPSNKFFEYTAHAKPLLSCDTGESRRLIAEYGIGFTYSMDDAQTLAAHMVTLADDPALVQRMGAASAALFDAHFDQSMLFIQMEGHMQTLARAA